MMVKEYRYEDLNVGMKASFSTEITGEMMETKLLSETAELVLQKNAEANPQKRNTKIEDVLPVVHYLLSKQAAFVTGQNIKITCGQ